MINAKNNNKIDLDKEINKIQKNFSLELHKIKAKRDTKIKNILAEQDLKDIARTIKHIKLNK